LREKRVRRAATARALAIAWLPNAGGSRGSGGDLTDGAGLSAKKRLNKTDRPTLTRPFAIFEAGDLGAPYAPHASRQTDRIDQIPNTAIVRRRRVEQLARLHVWVGERRFPRLRDRSVAPEVCD